MTAAVQEVGVALAIPDPRKNPVPAGWCEAVALPAIFDTDAWDALDEYEARLRAFASYIESMDGDALEFEKALRVLEKRRGDLLASGNTHVTDDESKMTRSRWRSIARAWEQVWPAIRDATDRRDVTQAAVLRRIEQGVHYRSDTDDWSTPQDLFDALHAEFGFEIDVCASESNAKCPTYFDTETDGLSREWLGVCWMNPPYGDSISRWVQKAFESAQAGATVVCLLPARTDTRWWWEFCRHGEIRFLRGRLRFGGGDAGAPFPSAVVVFGRPANAFDAHWERAA